MTPLEISCPHCGQVYTPQSSQEIRCPECGKTPAEPTGAPPPVPPAPAVQPSLPPPVAARAAPLGYARPGTTNAKEWLVYGRALSLHWWDHAKKALAKHARDIVVSSAEQDALAARGIADPAVQRHFSWRRSLLWLVIAPTTFTAVFGTIGLLTGDFEQMTGFGVLMLMLYAASLWAIPVTAFLAARTWEQAKRSRRYLLIGFLVSFLMIVLFGLTPFAWWIEIEDTGDPQAMQVARQMVAVIGGLVMSLWLLPAILSLLPGTIRSCVRIKVLYPESIVSGWLLITIAPLYALFLLTLFILINQAAGSFLLILGVACVVAAPVTYLVKTPLFIRPLWNDFERERLARAQWAYVILLAVASGFLVMYALTAEFAGKTIVQHVGFWTFTWNGMKFVVDYLGRSLFITALAMDYFLLINVSVWQNTREFERTEHAAEYEKTIGELGAVLVKE